jgi:RHS repeat-associated protein
MARPSDWSPVAMDSDPAPGAPDAVRDLSEELQTFADDVGEALGRIQGMASDRAVLDWAGLSADTFRAEFDGVPGNLTKLRTSYDLAAEALAGYWPRLENAQGLADRALEYAVTAQADLAAARAELTDATDWVGRAGEEAERLQEEGGPADAEPPDEEAVRGAVRDHEAARAAAGAAQSRVASAEASLEAARALAQQALELREDAARECARGIEAASDAGIQNRSWWENLVRWITEAWNTLVEICKVIIAVLGIVAMIIGGPLALIVLAAAAIVLVDTLVRYANGEGSLLDVAFAALDCVPGMRGLTTLGGLAAGARGLLGAARTGMRGIAAGVAGLGQRMRQLGRGIQGLATCGDPVDMATGELIMSAADVELPGVLPLVLQRHHRTSVTTGLLFGPSWASTLDQRLVLEPGGVRLVCADGMTLHYPVPLPDPGVLPVEGPHWPLIWDGAAGGTMVVRQPETGLSLRFRPLPGRPGSILPLAGLADRNGNTITVTHDADGLPTEVAHHGGYRVGVTCEAGHVTALTLRSHPEEPVLLSYRYDARGDLAEIVNASGRPLKLAYDGHHRITGWEDRNGSWYRYAYDEAGRCVGTRGPGGMLDYTFAYDDEARVTTAVDGAGAVTRYRFNDAFQLIEETDPLGHRTRQEWSRRDRLLARTDPLGHTTHWEWDPAGNLVAVRRPDGATATARYDAWHRPVELTGFDGGVRRQAWDDRGNCVALTDAAGRTTEFTREPTGALAVLTDPGGGVLRFTNNAAGQPVLGVDPLGVRTRIAYDPFGRIAEVTVPAAADGANENAEAGVGVGGGAEDGAGGRTLRCTWTVEGLPASRTTPDGATETWAYDPEGNCVSHTDPAGRTTEFAYTHFDLLAARTAPDGARVTYAWDAGLRLSRVTNAQGLTWDYRYDAAGRLVGETDFDGRTLAYGHDAAGRRTTRVNPLGQTVELTYDPAGRRVGKTVDGRVTTYAYTPDDRLLTAEGPDAALALEYDAAGRITAEIVDGRALTTAYDAVGRGVRRATPGGSVTRLAYDAGGHRTSLTTAGRVLTSEYDAAGRETTRRFGDAGPVLTQLWDAGDRLAGQTLTLPGAPGPLAGRAYRFGIDGAPDAVEDLVTGRRAAFSRDPAGRITGVDTDGRAESYAYDPAGNQTEASWPDAHPAQGARAYEGTRVVRAGAVHHEYDAAGRLVRRRRTRLSRKPDVWAYAWDAEDRLTGVTTPDGTRWRYRYDPLGRRVAKQRLAADGETVAEETRFVWDGPHLVEQSTTVAGRGESLIRTWERDGLRPLAQTERRVRADAPREVIDERFFAIVTDLVGTPTELVAESGEIAWRADATVWGVAGDPGPADPLLRFPGQYFDAETQLHYNVLRHYDPATALYVTPDPLGMDAGPGPRGYVPDPLLWIDPLGLLSCSQILRNNLAADGRTVGPGQAAAHIIPSGMNRGGAPGMRGLLNQYGVDVNEAANGIPLGHPRPHNFTHTNAFLGRLDTDLNQVVANRLAQNQIAQTPLTGAALNQQIATDIRARLRVIGSEIQNELANGTPAANATWTA